MKKSHKILLIVFLTVAGLLLARGALARWVIASQVKAITGMPLQIRRLDLGLFRPRVVAGGIKLFNPPGFQDKMMVDLPELSVEYDLPAFFRGQVHLREVRIDLREFVVVKNREGKLNLDSLTAVQKAKEAKEKKEGKKPAEKSNLRIDTLHLKIGKVVYKDYSAGEKPMVQEFTINLDEEYRDITDPTALGSLIVARALFNTTIAGLANFDLGALDQQVRNLLKDPLGKAGRIGSETVDAATGVVENTLNKLRKVIE